MKTVRPTLGAFVALAFCLHNVFANTPETVVAPDAANQPSPAEFSPPVVLPDAESSDKPETPRFGAGMQIPVDGTSLEAFDKSLADIQTKATKAEYTTLTNAIDYLMVYYIQAKRDRTKLAAHLNGKTGEQIVGMVQWDK